MEYIFILKETMGKEEVLRRELGKRRMSTQTVYFVSTNHPFGFLIACCGWCTNHRSLLAWEMGARELNGCDGVNEDLAYRMRRYLAE